MTDRELIEWILDVEKGLVEFGAERITEIASIWYLIESRLADELDAVAVEYLQIDSDNFSEGDVWNMDSFKDMVVSLRTELYSSGDDIYEQVEDARNFGFLNGSVIANQVLRHLEGGQILPGALMGRMAQFATTRLGRSEILTNAYIEAVQGVISAITGQQLTNAMPVQRVARTLAQWMGLGADRLSLTVRNEQIAYWRQTINQTYDLEGSAVVYKRMSAKTSTTCVACLFADGTIYQSLEDFSDHPNGFCMVVPIFADGRTVNWLTGRDVFRGATSAGKRRLLGKTRYEYWEKGLPENAFYRINNTKYGPQPQVTPIKDLRGMI